MVWAAQAPRILSRSTSVDSVTVSASSDGGEDGDEQALAVPMATTSESSDGNVRCDV